MMKAIIAGGRNDQSPMKDFNDYDTAYPESRILVGNIRDRKRPTMDTVYVGRQIPGHAGSPLGNPYRIKNESERPDALAKYKRWLDAQMQDDTPARQEIYKIATMAKKAPVMLLCFCKPALCHGDYVKEVIDKLMAEKSWGTAADSYAMKIYCHECNGYLWEDCVFNHNPQLIPCPYKGPGDHCENNP